MRTDSLLWLQGEWTSLHSAASGCHLPVVRALVSAARQQQESERGSSGPSGDKRDVLRELLEAKTPSGTTALTIAAAKGASSTIYCVAILTAVSPGAHESLRHASEWFRVLSFSCCVDRQCPQSHRSVLHVDSFGFLPGCAWAPNRIQTREPTPTTVPSSLRDTYCIVLTAVLCYL